MRLCEIRAEVDGPLQFLFSAICPTDLFQGDGKGIVQAGIGRVFVDGAGQTGHGEHGILLFKVQHAQRHPGGGKIGPQGHGFFQVCAGFGWLVELDFHAAKI